MAQPIEALINCSNPLCSAERKVPVQIYRTTFYWIGDCPECGKNIIRIQIGALSPQNYREMGEI